MPKKTIDATEWAVWATDRIGKLEAELAAVTRKVERLYKERKGEAIRYSKMEDNLSRLHEVDRVRELELAAMTATATQLRKAAYEMFYEDFEDWQLNKKRCDEIRLLLDNTKELK